MSEEGTPDAVESRSTRPRPTGRGVGAFVLGLALLVTWPWWHYPTLLGLGVALVLLPLLEWVLLARDHDVRVERQVTPLVVPRHGQCTGNLRFTGVRPRGPVHTVVVDTVAGEPTTLHVPAQGPATLSYDIPTRRRGLLTVGPLRVDRRGPLGLFHRQQVFGEVVEVRVLPRPLPIHALPPGNRRAPHTGAERIDHGGTDLSGLHPYVPGDDLRRLHWATSARTGTLMVREDADPSEPHLLVLLDDRAASYSDPDQFEDAVEVAAALCRTGLDHHNAVHLVTASGRVEVEIGVSSGRIQAPEAAALAPTFAEIDLAEPTDLHPVPRRDLDTSVAVTGPDADVAELVLALRGTQSGYLAMVAEDGPTLGDAAGVLVLRSADGDGLAHVWNLAVTS